MGESILAVINPIAGDRDKKSTSLSIKEWAQSSGIDLHIIETTGKNDHAKIEKKIKELQPDKVVSVGGDGTLILCAHILKDQEIPLGVLPMGSANGMAAELGIPTEIDEGLQIIKKGNTKKIDVLNFEDHDFGIHISDIGINARLVKQFEENGRRGFLGYAGGIFEEYTKPESFKVAIKVDGKELETSCLMLAFANAKRYGTGAMLNNKGKLDDGLMEVCILKKLDLTDIAEHFINLVDEKSSHIEVIQCKEVEVKVDRKMAFQIDGEVKPITDYIKVKVIPKGLKLIVP